jgi:acyl-CoA synthetase (AMP-forming)/AMP-acid ligase II
MSAPISAALDRHAAAQPDAPFLLTLERTFTYGEAAATVSSLRHQLRTRGIAAGERVLLLAHNGPEFVFGWLALAGLDATMVPLHRQLTAEGRARVEADVGATFLLGSFAFMEGHRDWTAIDGSRCVVLDEHVTAAPGSGLAGVETAEHPCSILYTSGTTGPPKGVVLSHTAYTVAASRMAEAVGLVPSDRILTALPLFHANPQFYAVATALGAGAAVALLDRFSADTFMDDAARLGATGFTYVGTILAMLARAGGGDPAHPVRYCVGGGVPSDRWQDLEERWGMRIHELYGSTETGSFVTLNTLAEYRRGSCGRPRADVDVAIVDEHDVPVAAGEHGEIVVRPSAPSVIYDGYYGRPDVTAARSRNLWFHTGDLARFDEDGYLYFAGRVDDRIRRAGENIDPRSVEQAIVLHPAIREVAVVGVADAVMGQEVKAVVVADGSFDPRSLPELLEGRLPRLAWPRFVEVRPELPKTATEKIALGELRKAQPSMVDLRA